jgi:hypothetical protein
MNNLRKKFKNAKIKIYEKINADFEILESHIQLQNENEIK